MHDDEVISDLLDQVAALKAERDALLTEVERLKGVGYDLIGQLMVLRATKQMTAAIAAAEREACAEIAEKQLSNTTVLMRMPPLSDAAWRIRNAIRARGEVQP